MTTQNEKYELRGDYIVAIPSPPDGADIVCDEPGFGSVHWPARAARIVTAVNNHDALVLTVADLRHWLGRVIRPDWCITVADRVDAQRVIDAADRLLASVPPITPPAEPAKAAEPTPPPPLKPGDVVPFERINELPIEAVVDCLIDGHVHRCRVSDYSATRLQEIGLPGVWFSGRYGTTTLISLPGTTPNLAAVADLLIEAARLMKGGVQ